MTSFSPPLILTWQWYLLIVIALFFQIILMMYAAPYFRGFVDLLAGRITGQLRYWPGGRWQNIRHQLKRPGIMAPGQQVGCIVTRVAFVLAIAVCGMVPVFSLSPPGFPAPGLLLICALLVLVSVLLMLPVMIQAGQSASDGYLSGVSDILLLPALTPILLMTGGQDLSNFLIHTRAYSPSGEGAPFVLAGAAIFLGALGQGGSVADEAQCPLSGADRGLWFWTHDILQLCWITLAGDIVWSGVLALPLPEEGATAWMVNCFYGTGGWVLKLVCAMFFLVLIRLVLLSVIKRGRVRFLSVFLAGLVAWQIATPLFLPVSDKNEKGTPPSHKTSWYNEEEGGFAP